jgi:hypothetical protein
MGDRAALMVAALCAYVVKNAAIGDAGLGHRVDPRRSRAVLQKGQFGALFDLDKVVKRHFGGRVAAQIDQRNGTRDAAGRADHDAIGRHCGVERGKRPGDRRLTLGLDRAVKFPRPVDVARAGLGQPHDLQPLGAQVVRGIGVEDAIDEDDLHPVDRVENHRLVCRLEQLRGRHLGCQQCRGVGKLPVFVAPVGQAQLAQTGHRGLARAAQPLAAFRQRELIEPRRRRFQLRRATRGAGAEFRLCGHAGAPVSARISA